MLYSINTFLDGYFQTSRYPDEERGGVYRYADGPVRRLALALEPCAELDDWLRQHQPDALWIHRPWKLDMSSLPNELGILSHHLPFDEHLTMGFNQVLAENMGLSELEEIGYKQAAGLPRRPMGMLGNAPERTLPEWVDSIAKAFEGYDSVIAGNGLRITRLAVVGAMNESLIREAAGRGCQLYLTGQYRPSAAESIAQTGISVIAVGHRRSEEWGLRALARLLQKRWPELVIKSLKFEV